jgi:hypothetical protein
MALEAMLRHHRQSRLPLSATVRFERNDIRQPGEAACLELPGELRDDVEAAGLRGSVERAGEGRLDLVCTGSQGCRIAPRLPHAGVNTPDFGATRIADRACFLDPPRILGCQPGFRFRRRKA